MRNHVVSGRPPALAERVGFSALPEPARPSAAGPWVAAGAVVFGVGLLATLVALVPFFLESEPMPTMVHLLATLAPVGLVIALVGIVRAARVNASRRR